MTMDDQTVDRLNWIYYIIIILCVLTLITTVCIIILAKAFLDLKRSIQKLEIPLPLVNVTTPQSSQSLHPGIAIGKKQKQELNEVVDRMPTPNPDRRNRIQPASEVSAPEQKNRMPSTSSGALSSDSGTGSIWDRNTSLSSNWSMHSDRTSRNPSKASQLRASVHEDSRTASDASGSSDGSKKKISAHFALQTLTVPQNVDNHDGIRLPCRSATMAIEDIHLDEPEPNESKRRKRASRILNEQTLIEEKEDENLSFTNRSCSEASQSSQRRAPLPSEECSIPSDDGPKRPTSTQNIFLTVSPNFDQKNESCLPGRLETMSIEMIDVNRPASNEQKRWKRASSILNERTLVEDREEESSSFVNQGYISARESSQRRTPLSNEESGITSDTQNVVDEKSDLDERYENQIIVDQHRHSGEFFLSPL